MKATTRIKRWTRRAMVALFALAVSLTLPGNEGNATQAQQQGREELREEFHRTYPLAAGGRVSLENVMGAVRITAWDRNEVRVDAVKRAYTAERLAEAEIRVEANADSVRIKTRYPFDSTNWESSEPRRYNNPATVEYTLTVPRGAQLDRINTVNGSLDLEGVSGDVDANSVNGQLRARGLAGRTRLGVVNGRLEASFDRIDETKTVELSSVNGQVLLTIPSDTNAEIRVSTVHGAITNDFGLPVRRGEYVGRELAGRLGRGGALVKLSNVNGQVSIKYAKDGRAVSPATNLLSETPRGRTDGDVQVDVDVSPDIDIDIDEEMSEKINKGVNKEVNKQVRKEMQKAHREIAREAARAGRDAARAERDRVRARIRAEVRPEPHINIEGHEHVGDTHRIEQESKSFPSAGVPRLRVETFDGHISIQAWDKPEVMFTASKRAHDEREMQGIRLRAEQRGEEILLVAEFDKSFSREVKKEGNRIVSFASGASVHYDVYVPRNASVRARTGDGRLRIENINGEVEAQTGDGSIDVSSASGRVSAQTGDGRISIIDFKGQADARTGDGRIMLDGNFTQLAAQTGDGSISLSLPADANATIETNAETVSTDGVAAAEDGDASGESERRVRRWRVGRGGNLFTLRTGDGQITLRQR